MNIRRIASFVIVFLVLGGLTAAVAQSGTARSLLRKGQEEYQKAQYAEALHDFREIILNPQDHAVHGDAYFWISLSYIALGQLSDAEKNLEYFLMHFKENSNVPEAYYQKGRLLYLQGEYDKTIQVLYTFIKTYPHNAYVGNGYYWIGESLYKLGHYGEAKKVFETVVATYPTSYKVEAAQYRISLIDLMTREQELLKLLKWSHEEALNAQEDYQRREQAYEQAIIGYQRQLAQLQGATATTAQIKTPSTKDEQIASLKDQISQLETEIRNLGSQLPAAAGASGRTAGTKNATEQTLLALKAKALDLKQFYLDWLAGHAGGGE